MKNDEIEIIKKILFNMGRKDLITNYMCLRNFEEIKKILSMPEWSNPRFSHLLTPTIWCSSYKKIEDKYIHLLSPAIFSISIQNIINGIELLKESGIDAYVSINSLRIGTKNLKILLDYIIENNYDLVIQDSNTGIIKLNPILNCTKKKLKEMYHIDIDTFLREREKYVYGF